MASVTFQQPAPFSDGDGAYRQAVILGVFLLFSLMLHAAVVFLLPDGVEKGAADFGSGGTIVSLGPAGREAGGEIAQASGAATPVEEVAATEAESVERFEALEEVTTQTAQDAQAATEVTSVQAIAEPEPEFVPPSDVVVPVNAEQLLELAPSPVPESLAIPVREAEITEPSEMQEPAEPLASIETQESVEIVEAQRAAPPLPKRRPRRPDALQTAQTDRKPSVPQEQRTTPEVQKPQLSATESAKPEKLPTGARNDVGESQSEQQVAGEGGHSGRSGLSEAGDGDDTPGGGSPGARSDYYQQVLAWLERHKRYPRRSKLRNEQGVVMLRFVVSRDGSVSTSGIKQSSGYKRLDKEALGMIERAQPLPAIPADMRAAQLNLVIPVKFELR